MSGRALAAALVLCAALVGCRNLQTAPDESGDADAPARGGRSVLVEIVDFAFRGPDGSDLVAVAPGDTVVFVNRDAAPHTATSTETSRGALPFDSGFLGQGGRFVFVPQAAGTWTYQCDFHPTRMRGARILVQGDAAGQDTTETGGGSSGEDETGQDGGEGDGGSGDGDDGGGQGGSGGDSGFGSILIDIQGFTYRTPNGTDTITVVVGQRVEWVNRDEASHTVTSTSAPAGASGFDSGRLRQGGRFAFTPARAGTWIYRCDFHDEMQGAVLRVVEADGADGEDGSGNQGEEGSTGQGSASLVRITDGGFVGPSGGSEVTLSLGEEVEWRNESTRVHDLKSTSEPDGGARFESGELAPGDSFRFRPNRTGTWLYRCNEHGEERDLRIVVR